ncbi:hypothetical protein M432DRAFT_606861 [Thermoascus aurantiacus ATCC 26904]
MGRPSAITITMMALAPQWCHGKVEWMRRDVYIVEMPAALRRMSMLLMSEMDYRTWGIIGSELLYSRRWNSSVGLWSQRIEVQDLRSWPH